MYGRFAGQKSDLNDEVTKKHETNSGNKHYEKSHFTNLAFRMLCSAAYTFKSMTVQNFNNYLYIEKGSGTSLPTLAFGEGCSS